MTKKPKQLKVTQLKSTAHRLQAHKDTARGLGLRRRHHTVVVEDTPAVRGMINAISYMVRVEEA
jgi:large subunit ribosomal protein L30